MSITKTNIVNQALLALGELVCTDVDSDSTKRATTMKELYDVKLNYLLRKFDWKFAIKRVEQIVIDYKLNFDGQQGTFTIGNIVRQIVDGIVTGFGTVAWVTQNGTSGTLWLHTVTGAFVDNLPVWEFTYGNDLMTNGSFTADTNWDKGAGVTITGGNAVFTGVLTGAGVVQTGVLTVGKIYKALIYIDALTSGSVYIDQIAEVYDTNFTYYTSIWQALGADIAILADELSTLKVGSIEVAEVINSAICDGTEYAATPVNEFDYIFALPSDYIKLIELYPDYIRYRLEKNMILCGESTTLDIKYTQYITDPDEFDAHFVEAFAALLAREAAIPLCDSIRKQKLMDEMYEDKIADARFSGSIEDDLEEVQATDWLQQRI